MDRNEKTPFGTRSFKVFQSLHIYLSICLVYFVFENNLSLHCNNVDLHIEYLIIHIVEKHCVTWPKPNTKLVK